MFPEALQKSFFPRVQPHDWPGQKSSVNRSLCYLPRLPGTPWLSVYFEVDGQLNYVDRTLLHKLGVTPEGLEAVAVRNIAGLPAAWESQRLGGEGHQHTVLACTNVPFASERMLIPEFMLQAQSQLGAKGLCATAPQRGMLLVAPFADFAILMALGKHFYEHAGTARLSPWVFSFESGIISGRFFEEEGKHGLDAVVVPSPPLSKPRSP